MSKKRSKSLEETSPPPSPSAVERGAEEDHGGDSATTSSKKDPLTQDLPCEEEWSEGEEDVVDERVASVGQRFSSTLNKEELYRLLRLLEQNVPESIRTRVIDGVVQGLVGEEGLVKSITDRNIPKEAAGFLVSSADSTRREILKLVSREVRLFLESVDLGGELSKILTSVSFEVNVKVGFVPRAKEEEQEEIKGEKQQGLASLDPVVEIDETKIDDPKVLGQATRRFIQGVRRAYELAIETIEAEDKEYSEPAPYEREEKRPSERLEASRIKSNRFDEESLFDEERRSQSIKQYTERVWSVINDRLIQPSLQGDSPYDEKEKGASKREANNPSPSVEDEGSSE